MTDIKVGDHVRVQRDEGVRPSKGTWPSYRNKTGFVCIVADGAGPDGEAEIGVVLTTYRPPWRQEKSRRHELQYDSEAIKWFAPHELVVVQ